jgi:hypothetical protein
MRVIIDWAILKPGDSAWAARRCLYVYADPLTRRLLYVGKAYSATVWERTQGKHKEQVFERLADKFAIPTQSLPVVLYGRLRSYDSFRVTKPVFRDVESLLIRRLRPFGNSKCKVSRTERLDLSVECTGEWWWPRRKFYDTPDVREQSSTAATDSIGTYADPIDHKGGTHSLSNLCERKGSTKPDDTPPRQGRCPSLPGHANIDDYNDRDLYEYLDWVQSDGLLRTDDELMDELFRALPFARRGSRIQKRLQRTVARFRKRTN